MASRNLSFDINAKTEGKDVKNTNMLKPGAREPFATGTNKLERQVTKSKPFGKLGVKGHAE